MRGYLKENLLGLTFIKLLAFVLASTFTSGLLLLFTDYAWSFYLRRIANPRAPMWRWGFWLVAGSLCMILFLASWRILVFFAIYLLVPLFGWIFGTK